MPVIRYPGGGTAPAPHHLTHEPGGTDEIHGVPTAAHHLTHEIGGTDQVSPVLIGAIAATEKGAALGVATLDASGYLPTGQLPPIAITRVYVVASEVAQLALTTDEGDAVIRTDINKTYFALNATPPPKAMSDYQEMLSPASVVSVCGKTGIVSLEASDITYAAESGKAATAATAMTPVVDSAHWTQYTSLWNTAGAGAAEAHGNRFTSSGISSTDPTGHWLMEWTTNGGGAWTQLFKVTETEEFTFGATGLGMLKAQTLTPGTSGNSLGMTGYVVDGGAAISVKIGSQNVLSTAGSKILSLYNDNITTERAYFDLNGALTISSARALGATGGPGLTMENTTAGANGAPQYSPNLVMRGYGFETTGSTSQSLDFQWVVVPTSTAAATTGKLHLSSSVAGAAYGIRFAVDTSGGVYAGNLGTGSFYGNYLIGSSANPVIIRGSMTDGATAYGVKLGNTNALSNATAKIVGFFSDSMTTERSYIDSVGCYNVDTTSLGTTSVPRISLTNGTAAAAGAQQYSPSVYLRSYGWKTDSGGSSVSTDWQMFSAPVQAAANPQAGLAFQFRHAAGTWYTAMSLRGFSSTTFGAYIGQGGSFSVFDTAFLGSASMFGTNPAYGVYGSASTFHIGSSIADGAGATAVKLGAIGAFSTATTKLLALYNAATEKSYFDLNGGYVCNVDNLGTTTTPRLSLTNSAAAAAGAQQVSPAIIWTGQGWKTDAVAGSQPVDFQSYVLPVQGTSAPSGRFYWAASRINSGSWTAGPYVDSDGWIHGKIWSAGTVVFQSAATSTTSTNITLSGNTTGSVTMLASGTARAGTTMGVSNANLMALYSTNAPMAIGTGDNYTVYLSGGVSDGSSAQGVQIKSEKSLTTVGAKIVTFYNSSTEKAYFGKDGMLSVGEGGTFRFFPKEVTPTALTIASIDAGGSVDVGDHTYKVTFVTAQGETSAGTVSATATTTGGNQTVSLSAIPIGSSNCTSRKLYRNSVAVPGTWRLLTTIVDNVTTTYADTATDASISGAATAPTSNTTANVVDSGTAGTDLHLNPTGGTGASVVCQNIKTTGSRKVKVTTVNAANYDLAVTDEILHVTYTATGTAAIRLMTAQMVEGRVLVVKDAGLLAGTNNITISTEGAEKIDGEDTYVMNVNKQAINIYSDGAGWFVY